MRVLIKTGIGYLYRRAAGKTRGPPPPQQEDAAPHARNTAKEPDGGSSAEDVGRPPRGVPAVPGDRVEEPHQAVATADRRDGGAARLRRHVQPIDAEVHVDAAVRVHTV